jgi:uncharacterized protein (TIGR02145 family)
MKLFLSLLALTSALTVSAQNYLISFAGSGALTTVTSVVVENLTSAKSITFNGTDILRLSGTTSINNIENRKSSELTIYPNPNDGNPIVKINPPIAGDADIKVFNMSGNLVAQFQKQFDNSFQEFRLTGISKGFYLVQVSGKTYQFCGKLLSNGNKVGAIGIEELPKNRINIEKGPETRLKDALATIDMAYTNGDRLKFTGSSGTYSVVVIDVPTESKTVTFNYVACSDGDGNNYPIVQIGSQIWMAENLKTTKYNNGDPIPSVIENTAWKSLSTGAFCYYNNDGIANKNTYGVIYNYYSISDVRKLCPTGWHVPTYNEWMSLVNFIGGESVAGAKLKETGTTHWNNPNTGATNESGFTALPAGTRYDDGTFYGLSNFGYWWTATEEYVPKAWFIDLCYLTSDVYSISTTPKQSGFSVRCVKD